MTHPLALHAITSLWSLAQAVLVAEGAARTARQTASEVEAGSTLQAWRPSSGRIATGGHADVVGSLLANASREWGAARHYTALVTTAQEQVDQVRYLVAADLTQLGVTANAIATVEQLADRLGLVRRPIAVEARGWLEQCDRRLRASLKMEPSTGPVPAAPECPVCTVRMLRLHDAAPAEEAWTVVCEAGCRCRGEACPCGMPERVAGDSHIWVYGTLPQPVPMQRRRGRIAA